MANGVKEREFQDKMIEWSIPLGWDFVAGRKLPREKAQTVIESHLRDAIIKLNPDSIDGYDLDTVLAEVVAAVNNVDGGLVAANEKVLDLLAGGREFRDKDGEWHPLSFIDFNHPTQNNLVVADEVTISVPGKTSRRFDLVYYVNGLPLVAVEVKSPTSTSTWRTAADDINNTYVAEYPWYFTPNVFCIAADGLTLRYGAAGAPTNFWQPFRSTADPETMDTMADVHRSMTLLLNPSTVLDILANFCLFDTAGGGTDAKYLPRYPQREAAHLIHDRVVMGGRKGLVWHHQGSGKTLLMVFAASLLLKDTRTASPTIIMLSDRSQIVRQTSGVFTSAMGDDYFHEPATSADLRDLLSTGVAGVISTTIHKFAGAGEDLSERDNIIVMIDEAHRTQSEKEGSLSDQMRRALPNARFFGMTGTPIKNLNTNTFRLFGDPADPNRVMHRYSMTRSLLDEATVPVALHSHPVGFDVDDEQLQAEFDAFADVQGLDEHDRDVLSRKFGRLTSVFANPERIQEVCEHIVDHYLSSAYRNGMKAQVVAYNRELAVAYTAKINEILVGYDIKQTLASVHERGGRPRHEAITAEVNISVSDAKNENKSLQVYRLTETEEEDQRRRFLSPENPLCFVVVTAKLMTGFDAPNEGVLYLDKPIYAHNLFQAITRPNRTWVSPVTGWVKPRGVIVDYVGLGEALQKAVKDPTDDQDGTGEKGPTFLDDIGELINEFRATFTRIEDLLAGVDGLDINRNDYESLRLISDFLDADEEVSTAFKNDYLLLSRLFPYVTTDVRIDRYRASFALFGSVYVTLFKKSTDEERKERLDSLGPMVLDIINANVHSFQVALAGEEPLVLDAQGLMVLKELMALVRSADKKSSGKEDQEPPTAKEILDQIKTALDEGVDEHSAKYVALAERIRELREQIIQGAEDALAFLTEALRIAQAVVDVQKKPDEVVVVEDDRIGVLTRIIADHAPKGLSITEKRLAEEIDQVVTRTLTRTYDNAEARSRAVRRSAAAVFRRYQIKPVGEPYDSTVAYIEAHYLVD
ncbi:HsdR family type I site-specific deoxyribonuclease [Saccharopolyspora gloriosae]|uniref:Type I restriction enzyme endonuclease subunit n=1 Tax=Saccharopolyspora gloriosae TaxID=455344 RepID=A0A840NFN3_9PSEU|nr:HsdR family type I site-specific deoxyribonuclease [Saccharopolyspora gloriosae]MBB5070404.1 type I restriction enzyme R subunit [Saccharopolyspora gloriosae]